LAKAEEGFLASLGMTAYGSFSAACEARVVLQLHKIQNKTS
jgi:hypothetical protein